MPETNLLQLYPRARRALKERAAQKSVNKALALQYGFHYFDGTREQGYGGYVYDGRWQKIAETFMAHWGLKPGDRVLEIGCAKGFLMKDLADRGIEVVGLDISEYAARNCHPHVSGKIVIGSADRLPFPDQSFAAVISINVLHNLSEERVDAALREMQRVAPIGKAYVQVDAYRTEDERDIFEDWVLTAVTYGPPAYWEKIFAKAGFAGDYYWTIIEADPEYLDRA